MKLVDKYKMYLGKLWANFGRRERAVNLADKYETYRRVSKELSEEIMDTCLDSNALPSAGRLLDIVRGKTFIFDSESDTFALADLALHEHRAGNKTAVELYRGRTKWKNEIEKEIVDAFLSSYTSLFKVVAVSKRESTIILSDILNQSDDIRLIDIGFSGTASPGMLMFSRVVPFKDFCMTSGISFVFPGDLEDYLLKEYKKLSVKVNSPSDSVRRFVSFFKLNRRKGIEMRYE